MKELVLDAVLGLAQINGMAPKIRLIKWKGEHLARVTSSAPILLQIDSHPEKLEGKIPASLSVFQKNGTLTKKMKYRQNTSCHLRGILPTKTKCKFHVRLWFLCVFSVVCVKSIQLTHSEKFTLCSAAVGDAIVTCIFVVLQICTWDSKL